MQTVDLQLARRFTVTRLERGLVRLKWHVAATRFEIALRRHDRALKLAYKYGYNPDQPRDELGRWTETGGGQAVRVAGGPTRGGGRGRYGGNFPSSTYGQQVRLDLNIARTENALRQIRQYDPNWTPSTQSLTAPGSIEGAIRDSGARAVEAEARLEQLRTGLGGNRGPSLGESDSNSSERTFDGQAWINAYRATNNMPDLFGRPIWSSDQGTVAVTELSGKLYFGVNSSAPGYSNADREAANAQRWGLINEFPYVMETKNIGETPNNSLYHAEATILLRAANEYGGTLTSRTIEVHVDREMCDSCREVLPYLGLRLGNPLVTFVNRTGRRRTMWNGSWLTGR